MSPSERERLDEELAPLRELTAKVFALEAEKKELEQQLAAVRALAEQHEQSCRFENQSAADWSRRGRHDLQNARAQKADTHERFAKELRAALGEKP